MFLATILIPATLLAPNGLNPGSETKEPGRIEVRTPLWGGNFEAVTREISPGTVLVTLSGTMNDPAAAQGEWKASISLEFDVGDVRVVSSGRYRAAVSNGNLLFYTVDILTPDALEWTWSTEPSVGTLRVWHAEEGSDGLSDAVVAGLYRSLIGLDDFGEGARGSVSCTPTYNSCLQDAKSTCSPNKVGSFTYECKQDGSVVCRWECLEPVGGGND